MQFGLLIVLAACIGICMREIVRWRKLGYPLVSRRLYRVAAWCVGLITWAAMLTQEAILLLTGQLSWRTGLPLHLCSAMGVLLLPMLLAKRPFLWHAALYLGIPGALLALVFPAIASTPWPEMTRVSFFMLHCMLVLAPLLPLSLGRRPQPVGALHALAFVLALGGLALPVNRLTGSNYLFLSLPVAGTPLDLLAQGGTASYRLILLALCVLLLGAEAAVVKACLRRRENRKL